MREWLSTYVSILVCSRPQCEGDNGPAASRASVGAKSGKRAVVLRDSASSLCGIRESKPKSYKCCIRCREEGILPRAYYCGRDCQEEDWNRRHRQFHKDRKAAKKSQTKEEPDPMYTVD